jgi:CDGSH-type Zn-finger protein/uncharacterized Fe-S cluster protein YjdI
VSAVSDVVTGAGVEVQKDGPYVVTGRVPLVRIDRRGNVSETYDAGDEYWLCRCGGSSDKPFCSDAHVGNGFEGAETAPTDTYAERATPLGGGILDDRAICAHAGFCANRITNVWDAASKLDDDAELREQVYAMVARCPSGALTLEHDAASEPVRVAVEENGPLHVTGRVKVTRADGQAFEARRRVLLCRCGESKAKPLCDGTHKKNGFQG